MVVPEEMEAPLRPVSPLVEVVEVVEERQAVLLEQEELEE
jgi:hypothetical protein